MGTRRSGLGPLKEQVSHMEENVKSTKVQTSALKVYLCNEVRVIGELTSYLVQQLNWQKNKSENFKDILKKLENLVYYN